MVAERKNAAEQSSGRDRTDRSPPRRSISQGLRPQQQLQDMMGNRAVNRLIQRALRVSQPNDPLENEAEQVASNAVRSAQGFQGQAVQEQQSQESKNERRPERSFSDRVLRRGVPLSATRNRTSDLPHMELAIQRAQGGGERLPDRLRQPMESALNSELDDVRIHAGAEANRLNVSLNARAFTIGTDVFFRQGEYRPETRTGLELIAHELVHVCQQSGDSIPSTILRREFGDAVRFDSLSADPPRARVLGSFPDEDIAVGLYGDPTTPITHLGEWGDTEDVIAIDYQQLLPEWRPYFEPEEYLFEPVFVTSQKV